MTTLDARGLNMAITGNILPEAEMRALGFTDHSDKHWYYVQRIERDITFNLSLPKDGGRLSIDVLDEDFGQPYDYQAILKRSPKLEFANSVKAQVESLMRHFNDKGIISGYETGMYI